MHMNSHLYGKPLKVAYEDIRIAPRSSSLQELNKIELVDNGIPHRSNTIHRMNRMQPNLRLAELCLLLSVRRKLKLEFDEQIFFYILLLKTRPKRKDNSTDTSLDVDEKGSKPKRISVPKPLMNHLQYPYPLNLVSRRFSSRFEIYLAMQHYQNAKLNSYRAGLSSRNLKRRKSRGVKSGDFGGHCTGVSLSIYREILALCADFQYPDSDIVLAHNTVAVRSCCRKDILYGNIFSFLRRATFIVERGIYIALLETRREILGVLSKFCSIFFMFSVLVRGLSDLGLSDTVLKSRKCLLSRLIESADDGIQL
eukprot:IDg3985t1